MLPDNTDDFFFILIDFVIELLWIHYLFSNIFFEKFFQGSMDHESLLVVVEVDQKVVDVYDEPVAKWQKQYWL